jgi:hypothetical protein
MRMVRRLDVPSVDYLVTLRTARTSRSPEQLRRLGFTVVPAGGPFAPLDTSRARVDLLDALGRSRSVTTQTLRVRAGGEASGFQGVQVPVVTTTNFGPGGSVSQSSTMDAGHRLRVRALHPVGADAVALGVATEQSEVVPSPNGLPAKRQAVAETEVTAEFGRPVVLMGLTTDDATGGWDGGATGDVQIQESRRDRAPPFSLGDLLGRRQVSVGAGGRRRREGGTLLVELTVRPAPR